MKRSSDPSASQSGTLAKKPKLSAADIQQVIATVATGAHPPPPVPPSTLISSSPVSSRLRPRPRAPLAPKTKAPRKTKPSKKITIQTAPPPSTTTTAPAPSVPSKSTPQTTNPPNPTVPPTSAPTLPQKTKVSPKKNPKTSSSATSKASTIPISVPSVAPLPTSTMTLPPQIPTVTQQPKSKITKASLVTSTVPNIPAPVVPVPIPPTTSSMFLHVPPHSNGSAHPKTKSSTVIPPPPKLTPAIQNQNQPPPSVTPEAAQILQQISPSQFTPSFLQSNLFEASLLPPATPEYVLISTYIANSQPHPFNIDLETVLNIKLSSSTNYPLAPGVIKNPPKRFCMMLWHGTKPSSIAPILENGFRCPLNGNQMFGQGIYFADRISKSAKYCIQDVYCTTPKPGEIGYIFLCEVTLGKCYNAKNSNSTYKTAPQITKKDGSVLTFDSLKCTGQNIPDRQEQREIDGVIWPMGKTVDNTKFPSYTVLYNEFIVYNPDMVDIRYLAKVKFS